MTPNGIHYLQQSSLMCRPQSCCWCWFITALRQSEEVYWQRDNVFFHCQANRSFSDLHVTFKLDNKSSTSDEVWFLFGAFFPPHRTTLSSAASAFSFIYLFPKSSFFRGSLHFTLSFVNHLLKTKSAAGGWKDQTHCIYSQTLTETQTNVLVI